MPVRNNDQAAIYACFLGYIVQAVVNNFIPLLFVRFQQELSIPLSKITFLITLNFLVQLLVDAFSAGFVDKIGYRVSIVAAHVFACAGLLLLPILSAVLPDPFIGLLISVMCYAVGGGLIEVLISPIMEASPSENKATAMSLLHSFYCWGQMGVVLLSTLFFLVFGISKWRILSVIWAVLPLLNAFVFTQVPIHALLEEGEEGLSFGKLLSMRSFQVLMVMMLCAGASEMVISQWASTFAEEGLGVSKTVGDLLGPMCFAGLMGTSRALYAKKGESMSLTGFMLGSAVLCMCCYLGASLLNSPVLNLLACALTGFSVGIFWPGTFSIASKRIPAGGTLMFALFAFAGDIGCSFGPTLSGMISSFSGSMKTGILGCIGFPVVMALGILYMRKGESDE